MRPTANKFSMWQYLVVPVVPYITPANQAPGVQTGHTPKGHMLI